MILRAIAGVNAGDGVDKRADVEHVDAVVAVGVAVGVAIGVAVGFGIGNILSIVAPFGAHIPMEWVFVGLGFCTAVGLTFGFYPAMRAAKLNPIDALHYE